MDNLEFKGTKGTWKAVELPYKIGECTHEIQFGKDGECITDGVYGIENANLIAAAPDLLEALQLILSEGKHSVSVMIAKKAIQKAIK